MTCGESTKSATVHQHIKDMFSFSDLLSYGNCYAISCLNKFSISPWVFSHRRCVEELMHIYHYHLRWCALAELRMACGITKAVAIPTVQPWTPHLRCYLTVILLQHYLTSLAHGLHYVVSANYYVAVVQETTGAEDHMRVNFPYRKFCVPY